MTRVYANLLGNWVCLNDDPECKMGSHMTPPSIWWEENAEVFSPIHKEIPHTMYQIDYIHIYYRKKEYRINPIFIQITS